MESFNLNGLWLGIALYIVNQNRPEGNLVIKTVGFKGFSKV